MRARPSDQYGGQIAGLTGRAPLVHFPPRQHRDRHIGASPPSPLEPRHRRRQVGQPPAGNRLFRARGAIRSVHPVWGQDPHWRGVNTTRSDEKFVLETSHSAATPRLRRLTSPVEHDAAYWEFAASRARWSRLFKLIQQSLIDDLLHSANPSPRVRRASILSTRSVDNSVDNSEPARSDCGEI
jgi:hypothetical protein